MDLPVGKKIDSVQARSDVPPTIERGDKGWPFGIILETLICLDRLPALSTAGADNLLLTIGSEGHEWSSNVVAEGTDLRADAPNELIGMERRRPKLRE